MTEIPKKIVDAEQIDKAQPIEPKGPSSKENTFAKHMEESKTPAETTRTEVHPSPMEALKPTSNTTTPTPEALHTQIQASSSSLGDIKNQLHTKNLKLKQSDKYLLRNKLSTATTQLRSANKNLGGNPGSEVQLQSLKNPITKFLAMVSDGQQQMFSAAEQLKKVSESNQALQPGRLLLIQVKLQKAQQELDYTSTILGKAVDMIKTLSSIQV